MNKVAALLSSEDIQLDLEVFDKDALLRDIAQFFEWRRGVNAELVYRSLRARETLGSTGIGHGVAIPHARIKDLAQTSAVFIRTRQPLEYEAPDNKPVALVLALLVPEHVRQEHLELLAAAAKLFSDTTFRERLLSSGDSAHIHSLFAA